MTDFDLVSLDIQLDHVSFSYAKIADEVIKTRNDVISSQLKAIKQSLSSRPSSFQVFVSSVLLTWSLLSRPEAKLDVSWVSFYKSAEVLTAVKAILLPVYTVLYIGAKDTGLCPLISGPVGVGKTTLLKSLGCVLSVLYDDRLVCVFNDYSKNEPLPSDLIATAAGVPTGPLKEVLNSVYSKGLSVLLLADEIQDLYVKSIDTNKIVIVKQIAEIGKDRLHVCVCTGSSMYTVQKAFYPSEFDIQPGYKTLNHTVFIDTYLGPITDQTEFSELYRVLFGDAIDGTHINALYIYTGGIFRFLACRLYSTAELNNLSRNVTIPSIDTLCGSECNDWLSALLSSMVVRIQQYLDNDTYQPWQHSTEVSFSEAQTLANIYGVSNFKHLLRMCCEKSILKHVGQRISVLRPAYLVSLYHKDDLKTVGVLQKYAFLGTLTGWSDSGYETYPSAGHRNEDILLKLVLKLKEIRCPTKSDNTLSNATTPLDVNNFLGFFITGCSNLEGIEGFLLTRTETGIEMMVVQAKSGQLKFKITVKEFNGHLGKARSGAASLIRRFNEPVELSSIVIVYTKIVPPEVLEIIESDPIVTVYDRDDVLTHAEIDSATKNAMRNWLTL